MVIYPNNNPTMMLEEDGYCTSFAQTRNTLIDTEIYSSFVYSCENNFRRSKFYRDYKSDIYNLGLTRDQMMPGINSEMVDLELHHNMIELKYATIMIIEHLLNHKGCCTSCEVVHELEEAHRDHLLAVIMLCRTNHENYHANPTSFISLKQCLGYPFKFIEKYKDGMTIDIAYKMLLHLKQEEQYGDSFTPQMAKARDEILSWGITL